MKNKERTSMSEQNKKPKENKKMLYGIIAAIILVIVIGVIAIFMLNTNKDKKDNEIAYTDLIKKVEEGSVEKIEMTVGSTSVKVKLKDIEEEKTGIVPNTQAFIELIQEKTLEGNNIELIQKKQNVALTILQNLFGLDRKSVV